MATHNAPAGACTVIFFALVQSSRPVVASSAYSTAGTDRAAGCCAARVGNDLIEEVAHAARSYGPGSSFEPGEVVRLQRHGDCTLRHTISYIYRIPEAVWLLVSGHQQGLYWR